MVILNDDEKVFEITKVSSEAFCMSEYDIKHKLLKTKPKTRTYKINHDNGYFVDFGEFVHVLLLNRKKKKRTFFLADIKTGSLYDVDTMHCMSGSLYLT